MTAIVITRCFPYRPENGVRSLLEAARASSELVWVLPAEGLWKPYYRENVPPMPEGTQVRNCPSVTTASAVRMAWKIWRGTEAGLSGGSLRDALRAARVALAVRIIVFEEQERLAGYGAEYVPAQMALRVARSRGWLA